MALRVNASSASGISNNMTVALENLNTQYNEMWQRGWVASLISSPLNDDLELKLASEDGTSQRRIIHGAAGMQDPGSVCAILLKLRSMWG